MAMRGGQDASSFIGMQAFDSTGPETFVGFSLTSINAGGAFGGFAFYCAALGALTLFLLE